MTASPKPAKSKKMGIQGPLLTKHNYQEIGEKIGESLEFGSDVEIITFSHNRFETHSGVVKSVDGQRGIILLYLGGNEYIQIKLNAIVSVT